MNIQAIKTATIRRVLAVSAVALLGTSAAMAQAAAPDASAAPQAQATPRHGGPRAEQPRWDPQRAAEHMQRRQAELKAKLQITPQQEAAWATWSDALKPRKDMPTPDAMRAERAALAQLTTPERIDRMRALKAQRDLHATQREDATKAFYASLTPTQQKVFDAETLPGAHGPRPAAPPPPHAG